MHNIEQQYIPKNLNGIYLSGINHRSASIEIREKFAFGHDRAKELTLDLLSLEEIDQAVVLSTCNRVEFLYNNLSSDANLVANKITTILNKLSRSTLQNTAQIYHLKEDQAVRHLFQLASGMDSLIVGEPQILGQLKDAFNLAKDQGAVKNLFHRLFDRAFHVAKLVRSQTAIGRNAISVCYAAKELAKQVFGDLKSAKVMLIGSGDTGALAAKNFASAGVKDFYFVNRTFSRACELAGYFKGVPLALSAIENYLDQVDIIIGAANITEENSFLLHCDQVAKTLRKRSREMQLYLDLAVPRNFDPEIENLDRTFLYNVDHLEKVVSNNINNRLVEIKQAELIVDAEVAKFINWIKQQSAEEVVKNLIQQCKSFEQIEISKSLKEISKLNLTEEAQQKIKSILEDLSAGLLAKVFHQPFTEIKKTTRDKEVIEILNQLFIKK